MTKGFKSETEVVVVNPSSRIVNYQQLSSEVAAIEPPIWAGLITNGLRAQNVRAEIIDVEGLIWSHDLAVDEVEAMNPRLVVVVVYGQQPSASTQCMSGANDFVRKTKDKNPSRRVLMMGGHPSTLPEQTLRETRSDFIACGEGLRTVLQLNQRLKSRNPNYSQVDGLAYIEKGVFLKNKNAALIKMKELDSVLPGISWESLPMKNYRAHNWHCFDDINERQPYASLYTSLGCPYSCSFCCINSPFEKSMYRHWTPEFVVSEIDTLVNRYGVKNIKIADEMFVLKTSHYLKICDLLMERSYGLNIWAYSRVDTVKPEYLPKLKKAGVNWLALGIESGSEQVRNGVTKGQFEKTNIFETVRQIKEAGIHVMGNFIFGLPEDDRSSMQETLDLALELNCEMANFYSAMAYPGSQLYSDAIARGMELPKKWSGYSQHSYDCQPLSTKYLNGADVLRFRDQAWQKYFRSPSFLKMIDRKFGNKASQHLREVSKIELKREILEDYGTKTEANSNFLWT